AAATPSPRPPRGRARPGLPDAGGPPMNSRFHFLLTAAALLLCSTTALADRSNVTFTPLGDTPIGTQRIGTPVTSSVSCELGETRPVAGFVSGYLFPPNDRYFTPLRPEGCGARGVRISVAHVLIGYNVPCDIPVEVSIVGSLGDPACPVPDMNRILCPPTIYTLSAEVPGGYDFGMALPNGCCITSDAFLQVRFISTGNCNPLPLLGAVDPPCLGCFSYNDNPGVGFVDICGDPFWPSDQAGNPKMYADATCCDATPTKSQSWGRLKVLYR